jgi:AraC-like DNA-binding protein
MPPHEEMRAIMRSLADAFERGAIAKAAATREVFIRQIMFASLGRVDTMRSYLVGALQMLLERFERKSGVGAKEAKAVGDRWSGRLMEAMTPPDMVGIFRAALENLARYQVKPQEAGASTRIESILQDLADAPGKTWTVAMLCRRVGMSPPTFLKRFHQTAGMAFGPYLRHLRLVKAREMAKSADSVLPARSSRFSVKQLGSPREVSELKRSITFECIVMVNLIISNHYATGCNRLFPR